MSGALGTVLLAGVTSGVISISGVVEVAPTSISFSDVVTTSGVGVAVVPNSFSVSIPESGVFSVAVEVPGVLVPIIIGVGVRVATLLSFSFSESEVLIVVFEVSGVLVSITIEVGVVVATLLSLSFSVIVARMGVVVVNE